MARKDDKRRRWDDVGIGGRGGERQADLCARIGAGLTREMSVLELCCGEGQMTLPLCGTVALWEATDPSEALITRARRIPHSDRLRFIVMDAECMPYEHSTFDAVVACNALQSMQRPEPALREIRRVLQPGGILFAPTVMFGGRKLDLRARITAFTGRRIRQRWMPSEFLDLIRRYGFSVEKAVLLPDESAPICYLEARSLK